MKSSGSRVVIIERKQPNDENDAESTPGEDIQERQQPVLGKYTRNENVLKILVASNTVAKESTFSIIMYSISKLNKLFGQNS